MPTPIAEHSRTSSRRSLSISSQKSLRISTSTNSTQTPIKDEARRRSSHHSIKSLKDNAAKDGYGLRKALSELSSWKKIILKRKGIKKTMGYLLSEPRAEPSTPQEELAGAIWAPEPQRILDSLKKEIKESQIMDALLVIIITELAYILDALARETRLKKPSAYAVPNPEMMQIIVEFFLEKLKLTLKLVFFDKLRRGSDKTTKRYEYYASKVTAIWVPLTTIHGESESLKKCTFRRQSENIRQIGEFTHSIKKNSGLYASSNEEYKTWFNENLEPVINDYLRITSDI